jgi:ethanolaminephosphotransferase
MFAVLLFGSSWLIGTAVFIDRSSSRFLVLTAMVFESEYLRQKALDNLKHYKYGAIDLSPLSKYILQPYWNWCVQFMPLWLAPNLITFIGLMFVFANTLLMSYLVPDLVGPTYPWVYFSGAAGIWIYSTMDNIDGKQARRTNSSSPLGELFDHGCDALNCSLGAIIQVAAMGLGHTWYSAYVAAIAIVAFFFSTWEEYHTGVMYLGYINGPTEGLVLACSVMIASGIFGKQSSELIAHLFQVLIFGRCLWWMHCQLLWDRSFPKR